MRWSQRASKYNQQWTFSPTNLLTSWSHSIGDEGGNWAKLLLRWRSNTEPSFTLNAIVLVSRPVFSAKEIRHCWINNLEQLNKSVHPDEYITMSIRILTDGLPNKNYGNSMIYPPIWPYLAPSRSRRRLVSSMANNGLCPLPSSSSYCCLPFCLGHSLPWGIVRMRINFYGNLYRFKEPRPAPLALFPTLDDPPWAWCPASTIYCARVRLLDAVFLDGI